ncbi:class D sortase [Amylibacter sp.]|nr:class D sortase [Amylibacter sp.]
MYKKIFVVLGCCLIILGLVGITKASLMPIKAIIGQHYLEVAWKESLKSNKLSKPWKSADFYMIGELKVPKLKVSRVILNSVSGEAMAWSIGRVTNLGNAIDKQPIILAGHRDSHMQFMSELNIGDKIELTMSDGVLTTYIISGTEVSDKPEVALSSVTLGSESLILTTCWPFNAMKSGDQRYLIFADKVNVSASIDNA